MTLDILLQFCADDPWFSIVVAKRIAGDRASKGCPPTLAAIIMRDPLIFEFLKDPPRLLDLP